ncbi:MAG: NYN domain-containing protein [Coriobacteriia bacterium]|nr:NYN domain-containing protein [Coriobacteriia bacterium]
MRFLVDGYNITKSDPASKDLPLRDQREALASRLAVRGADLLGREPIVIVFDGAEGGGSEARRGQVEVRYARGETADDMIVRMVTGGDTVVTSDRGLAERVSAAGARVLGADACFEGRHVRRTGRYPARTAGLPNGANKITEELKSIWLDDEE